MQLIYIYSSEFKSKEKGFHFSGKYRVETEEIEDGGKIYIQKSATCKCRYKNRQFQIESTIPEENNNLKEMNIIQAYQNHKDYAAEVVKKIMIYNNPQTKKLISSAFKNENINLTITDEEFERLYFGNYMNKEDQGKRILCKLASDFYNSTKNHPH